MRRVITDQRLLSDATQLVNELLVLKRVLGQSVSAQVANSRSALDEEHQVVVHEGDERSRSLGLGVDSAQ